MNNQSNIQNTQPTTTNPCTTEPPGPVPAPAPHQVGDIPDPPLSAAVNPEDGETEQPEEFVVISTYSRAQAIEDGFQVDANIGDLADVSRQHYKFPVFMTQGVWDIIEKAVANERWHNDVLGVWHDILHMSKWMIVQRLSESCHLFQVIIKGAGRKSTFTFKAECGPLDIDDPSPSVTISLRDED